MNQSPLFFLIIALTEYCSTGIPSNPEHEGVIQILPGPLYEMTTVVFTLPSSQQSVLTEPPMYTLLDRVEGDKWTLEARIRIFYAQQIYAFFINSLVRIKEL